MSSTWNSESLDELMSELERMEQKCKPSKQKRVSYVDASEALREADAVLGLNKDPLAGLTDLSKPTKQPKQSAPAVAKEHDVIVRETRSGQKTFETKEPEEVFSHSLMGDTSSAPAAPQSKKSHASEQPKPKEQAAPADDKTKVFGAVASDAKPHAPVPGKESLDGQITFDGYEDETQVEQVDEEQAQRDLKARRAEQLSKFKLLHTAAKNYVQDLPPDNTMFEDEEPRASKRKKEQDTEKDTYKGPEYTRLGERKDFARLLDKERRSSVTQAGIMTLLEIVMVILSIVSARLEAGNRAVLYAVCLVALSVSVAFSLNEIIAGLRDLIRLKPSCKSAAFLVCLATLAQAVVAFILPGAQGIPCTFCVAAGLALWFGKVNKLLESYTIMGNFKICAYTAADHLHTVRTFAEKQDAFEVGEPLKIADPQIRYSDKTSFPSDFMRNSNYRTVADRLCIYLIPSSVIVALIAALAGWISTKTGLSALTAFTGALCVSMPTGAAFATLVPVVMTMFHVNRYGGMIVSPDAACVASSMQALAIDILDLYKGKDCDLGYKDYNTMSRDKMLMYAATMAFSSGSPISGALRESFPDEQFLPEVKSLIYEERLGLSGIVSGQSVLLGNRNLLINHSVEAPAKGDEQRYLEQGKRVLYLAVGNKVAAMLVVKYKPDARLKTPLKVLENNGVHALVYAPDSNLHEDYIAKSFGLTKGEVVLMSPKGGFILRNRSARESESAPVGLMHNGTGEAMLRTVAGALTIQNIQRLAAFASIICGGIGWLISFILMLVRGIDAVNWVFVCLYTLIGTIICIALGVFQYIKSTGK